MLDIHRTNSKSSPLDKYANRELLVALCLEFVSVRSQAVRWLYTLTLRRSLSLVTLGLGYPKLIKIVASPFAAGKAHARAEKIIYLDISIFSLLMKTTKSEYFEIFKIFKLKNLRAGLRWDFRDLESCKSITCQRWTINVLN